MTASTPPDFIDATYIDATYNVAPTDKVPVIIWLDGERHWATMEPGLVPHWIRDVKSCSRPINARADGILEKPYFKEAVQRRRCLVPMSGYYEWEKSGSKRLPYYLCQQDRAPFSVAGIWERWKSPIGPLYTFATVTVEANELISPIHDRMLVVLGEPEATSWLDPKTPIELALSYLRLHELPGFELYRVSRNVNRVGYNQPDCIEPIHDVDEPDEPNLFGKW